MIYGEVKRTVRAAPAYPYLGICNQHGLAHGCVVLFTEPNIGTCLVSVSGTPRVGMHCTHWAEREFDPLDGAVILKNSAES